MIPTIFINTYLAELMALIKYKINSKGLDAVVKKTRFKIPPILLIDKGVST